MASAQAFSLLLDDVQKEHTKVLEAASATAQRAIDAARTEAKNLENERREFEKEKEKWRKETELWMEEERAKIEREKEEWAVEREMERAELDEEKERWRERAERELREQKAAFHVATICFQEEKAHFNELAERVDKVFVGGPLVKVNVGGVVFSTSAASLKAAKGTFFDVMFSGHNMKELLPQEDGSYFIDADPTLFPYVLQYLRCVQKCVDFPIDAVPCSVLDALLLEATFYSLNLYGNKLDCVKESGILSPYQRLSHALVKFLKQDGISTDCTFPLLHRASRDGWRAVDFHAHCDNKGPTVVLIRSIEGYIFGGYTEDEWDSSGDTKCGRSFLFSLSRPNGGAPSKLGKGGQQGTYQGIYCSSYCGPAFLEDVCVRDKPNESACSTSALGVYYDLPLDCGGGVGCASCGYLPAAAASYLAGGPNFTVGELEVLQVV